jgi:hypothetical protein
MAMELPAGLEAFLGKPLRRAEGLSIKPDRPAKSRIAPAPREVE